MEERALKELIERVKRGRVSRRRFIEVLARLGIAAPLAGQILMHAGVVSATGRPLYRPRHRGGGGALRLLMWQGPTLLNPHFAVGTKDLYGARLFYQALAEWDSEANLLPILAAEIPSIEAGTLARDGRWVVWKLKRGVRWHDGKPFTADDVVFNWEYAADPATAATTIGTYQDIRVEKQDSHAVRIVFKKPTPFWANAFVGARGLLVPRHHFEAYRGAKSRDAPANVKPVGTGPYRFVDFKPGDNVRGVINPDYYEPHRPFFDSVEMKGGGDAVSAARAVLQTGEFDYAWNLQVEDEILLRLEQGGKGRLVITPEGTIEHVLLNAADPWTEVSGERASVKTRHPVFSDPATREAFSRLVDRASIQQHIYGRTGIATANYLNLPERYRSASAKPDFDVAQANEILEAAGWKRGPDGIRAKNGRRMQLVFRTSINAPRQKTQQIIKQACQKAGIDLELKAIAPSIYFSSDVGNPDTLGKFYSDIQMFAYGQEQPDPDVFMNVFCSWEIASRDNKWVGRNSSRWSSEDYDRAYRAAQSELDPAKRAALFIRMNDLAVGGRHVIPLVLRPGVAALGTRIRATFSSWASDVFLLQDWYRES